MTVIYNKRGGTEKCVKNDDFPVKEEACKIVTAEYKGVQTKVEADTDKRIKSKIRTMRKKRHFLRRLAVSLVLFLLFVSIIDIKILGGYLGSAASEFVKDGMISLLDISFDKTGENTLSSGRTLYTMQYSDAGKTESTGKTAAGLISETAVTKKTDTEETKEVHTSEDVSLGNVDGVTYYPITKKDLSAQSVFALSNGTSYSPDTEALSHSVPASLENLAVTDEPLVLIVHTHGGECYSENDDMYPENAPTRTTDETKNVVRVGSEIASVLSEFGITTLHCPLQHDRESFINAYTESAKTVKKYLEEYPSIKFVIDVHRDAIIRDDGESIKAVKSIAGQDYAQIMFVVGTNELGHNHPDWQENLGLAVKLQDSIEDTYPGLCRSINLRDVPFNQQLSDGYLILEVGTCANTLDEALLSARAFAENLARIIYENS